MKRNRTKYFLLIVFTILLGLFSRSRFIPAIIYPYLGDVLYGLMIFFIMGFIIPRMESHKTALISIVICWLIECFQLIDYEYLNQLKNNYRICGLILGYGFLWSDMLAYLLGGFAGFFIEKSLLNPPSNSFFSIN